MCLNIVQQSEYKGKMPSVSYLALQKKKRSINIEGDHLTPSIIIKN